MNIQPIHKTRIQMISIGIKEANEYNKNIYF